MKQVRNIFGFFYKLYFGLVFFSSLVLLYPLFWVLLSNEKYFPLAFKIKRFWARMICSFSFIFPRIEGKENIKEHPGGLPYVICANHASYFDIIMMYVTIPHYFVFIGKAELKSWPLFKIFFTKEMNIAVERSSKTASHKSYLKSVNQLKKGNSLAIFPEGGIPNVKKPKMVRFKNGAFKMALEDDYPILPITFLNNWRLFSDPETPFNRAHPGISKVIIHTPIDTSNFTHIDLVSLREEVKDIIEKPLKKYY